MIRKEGRQLLNSYWFFFFFSLDFYFMSHCQLLIKQFQHRVQSSLWSCSTHKPSRYFITLYEAWWRKQAHWWQKQNGVSPLVVRSGNTAVAEGVFPRGQSVGWKGNRLFWTNCKAIDDWKKTTEAHERWLTNPECFSPGSHSNYGLELQQLLRYED